uniref:(northern house mosquito) hypothetical protein n=1 Tax=Culex pipiens TaxID=7175 RepID=A0A8D8KDU0_CULPI
MTQSRPRPNVTPDDDSQLNQKQHYTGHMVQCCCSEWSTIVAEAVNGVWCDLRRPMTGNNSTKATRANIPAKYALKIPMSGFTTPGEVDQEEIPTQAKVCDITSADDSINEFLIK